MEERSRSDRLLHQMLPPEVADQLRHGALRTRAGSDRPSCETTAAGTEYRAGSQLAAKLRGSASHSAQHPLLLCPYSRVRSVHFLQARRWMLSRTRR